MEIDLVGLVLPRRAEIREGEDGRSAKFVLEPLERGYGHTLGNSIRRVLLSSLRGSAVWSFRIDGVVHEHQTIPGVMEDVHQVIQNLKSLVVVLDDEVDEARVEIQADSEGPVLAGQIKSSKGVRVLDPEHHILTLAEDRELNIELRVNKGRGFLLADQHELPRDATVDLVRIDALYNPIRRANFQVEETRVGQRTDFDRLTLTVETDGSITPLAAVEYASELVRKHFEYFFFFESGIPTASPEDGEQVPPDLEELFREPFDNLAELSVRARNTLQKENITTVGDLVRMSEDEMLELEHLGKKTVKEISDFLGDQGLRFGMKWKAGDDGHLYFVTDAEEEEAETEETEEAAEGAEQG